MHSRHIKIIKKTMAEEGGYVDNPRLIDQPTNIGITTGALNTYNANHPHLGFPTNVRELTPQQVAQIYQEDYYDKRRINEIKNDRIAAAVFDMGVMSNFAAVGRTVQKTLNETTDTNLTVDGVIGRDTIAALNNISENSVPIFMYNLKQNRLKYLQKLPEWHKYGNGWTARTARY